MCVCVFGRQRGSWREIHQAASSRSVPEITVDHAGGFRERNNNNHRKADTSFLERAISGLPRRHWPPTSKNAISAQHILHLCIDHAFHGGRERRPRPCHPLVRQDTSCSYTPTSQVGSACHIGSWRTTCVRVARFLNVLLRIHSTLTFHRQWPCLFRTTVVPQELHLATFGEPVYNMQRDA